MENNFFKKFQDIVKVEVTGKNIDNYIKKIIKSKINIIKLNVYKGCLLNSIELELNLIGVCSGAMTFIQIVNLLNLFWCELKIKYIEIFGLSFFV